MDRLKMPDGEAIEAGIVTRSIESAQRKVEARNFDIRKQLLEYDDVSNDQRKVIYQQRNDILDAGRPHGADRGAARGLLHRPGAPVRAGRIGRRAVGPRRPGEERWPASGASTCRCRRTWKPRAAMTDEDVVEKVVAAANEAFDAKVALIGQENFTQFERMVLLQSIDTHWREHLASLDYLRQGIHLRGYAQKQPKQEYKREAFELFGQLLDSVKNEVTRQLMTVRVQSSEQLERGRRGDGKPRREPRQHHLHRAHRDRRGRGAGRRGKPAPRRPPRGLSAGAAGLCARRPQRSLPLRQRQEIQALPRQAELISHARSHAMPVNLSAPDPAALLAVPGVRIGVAEAGMRKANRKDLTVVLIDEGAAVGGVFTQNRFCAAPVQVCREHLAQGLRHPRDADQHRQRQCRHRRGRPGAHARHLHRAGAQARARARADPAVLHRRDHGAAADRPHRSRPAGRAGRCLARPTGRARPKAS